MGKDNFVGLGVCPVTRTPGKKVDTATVKCLLSTSLSEVQDTQYYFCGVEGCPVVYFSSDGTQTFSVEDVRERVFQKEPNSDDVLVCYCFQYTVGDVRTHKSTHGRSPIVAAIKAGIDAGQCACDWRNPQGDCCMGNVIGLSKKPRED